MNRIPFWMHFEDKCQITNSCGYDNIPKLKKVIFQKFIMWSVSGHYTTKYHQLNWDQLTETFVLNGRKKHYRNRECGINSFDFKPSKLKLVWLRQLIPRYKITLCRSFSKYTRHLFYRVYNNFLAYKSTWTFETFTLFRNNLLER